jgi:protein SCO1
MSTPIVFLASGFSLAGSNGLDAAHVVKPSERAEVGHVYGHLPPNPDQLGGAFNFSTLAGGDVSEKDFKGRWTLLYFGYARCSDSCPVAIPVIAQAAKELRQSGVDTRAVFVDIEASAIGNVRRGAANSGNHTPHPAAVDRMRALKGLQASFGDELELMTGTRGQLSAATVAFRVAREHIPPRAAERGHSINHSSLVYMLDTRARVAGYGYHTSTAKVLVETVRKLRRA